MRRAFLFALAGLALSAPARAAEEAALASVVERAIADYIAPAYEELHAKAAALAGASARFCAVPDEAAKAALADAFAATLTAWAGADFFRFGPMARDSRYERFAFWPDVHGTGARQLRQFLARDDEALLQPGALAKQSAAVQGLPALESLLYSGAAALMQADAPDPFRCRLAVTVAANMEALAAAALADWQGAGGWAALMRAPSAENPVYRSHGEAMTEILRAILTGLEQLRDHRLLPAIGTTPEEAKASRAPYARSGEAMAYLAAAAAALEHFVEASGILTLIPESQGWIAGAVAFEFANLRRALAAAGPDLEAALSDPQMRGKLVYATIVLASLRDLFQNRLFACRRPDGGLQCPRW